MISILDYGAGNLRSVQNTLDEIGADYRLVHDGRRTPRGQEDHPARRRTFRADDARPRRDGGAPTIARTHPRRACRFWESVSDFRRCSAPVRKRPSSAASAFSKAKCGASRRATCASRIWDGTNSNLCAASKLLSNLGTTPYVYFAHSYYAPVVDSTAATCTYTLPYTAVLDSKNIFGVQFHPEKSGPLGLAIVRNFIELC